jgi:hypothetical protein
LTVVRAVAIALLVSACSFFSHSPKGYRLDRGKPTCNPTPAFVADSAVAIVGLALALSGLAQIGCEAHSVEGPSDCQLFAVAGAVVLAAGTPGTVVGVRKVARCRSSWSTYDRAADAAREVEASTGLIVELRATAAVIVTGRGSETCAEKPWAAELTRLAPRLDSAGITAVECRAGEELVWSSPVGSL